LATKMTAPFSIERYDPADFDAVDALWVAAGMPRLLRQEIGSILGHGGQLLVARDIATSAPIGTVLWTFDGQRATARKVTVRGDRRRLGVAEALMIEARRQMREAGIAHAVLYTRTGNTPAERLYAKLGWTVRATGLDAWQIAP